MLLLLLVVVVVVVVFGMAVVFKILIALLALPARTGVVATTGSSSELHVYNALSQHVSPKLNNNTTRVL